MNTFINRNIFDYFRIYFKNILYILIYTGYIEFDSLSTTEIMSTALWTQALNIL